MATCPRCSAPVEDESSRFCVACGASLPSPGPPSAVPQAGEARCAAHPDRAAMEICSRCGAFACPQCLSFDPQSGAPLCAGCAARTGETWTPPWEKRADVGLLKAWWETTKGAMFSPGSTLGRLAPSGGSAWDYLSYAFLSGVLGMVGTAVLYAGIFGAVRLSGAGKPGSIGATEAGVGMLLGTFVVAAFFGPAFTVFALGGLEHLMLRLLEVDTKGFLATVRGSCYAYAPQALGIVPYCGMYVASVWQLVCRIFAYKGAHQTTGGKATAAVLVPILTCCVGSFVVYGVGLALAFAH